MTIRNSLSIAILGLIAIPLIQAQESKINTNVGMGVTVPVNPTAAFVGASANANVGVGYNFDRHHSFVGQFMWSNLRPNRDVLRPIRLLTKFRDIDSSSNLYTLTANYRFRQQWKTFGVYAIGGGGLYYRFSELSRDVVVGRETVCAPAWTWWGFSCFSGFVTDDQTLISNGSTAFGGNAGLGFTIRINEEGYKFYIEARYHYAPTSKISTQIIPITLGFSW